MQHRARSRRWPGGLVGTYALYLMSRAPIYGGQLTRRIETVTKGAWHPGAGAIYPILQGLVRRGDAAVSLVDHRKTYRITRQGTARLREVRQRIRTGGSRFAELRGIILDMAEPDARVELLELHLARAIRTIAEALEADDTLLTPSQQRRLRRRALALLRQGLGSLAPSRRRRSRS